MSRDSDEEAPRLAKSQTTVKQFGGHCVESNGLRMTSSTDRLYESASNQSPRYIIIAGHCNCKYL